MYKKESSVLRKIGATPEEVEELSHLFKYIDYINISRLMLNDSILCEKHDDIINVNGIIDCIYSGLQDLPLLRFLVRITTVVLIAIIYKEEDTLPLKEFEHLLYNGSVFIINSRCPKSGINPKIKCFILIDNTDCPVKDELYDPMFQYIKHSKQLIRYYHRNIMISDSRIVKYLKNKDIDTVTVISNIGFGCNSMISNIPKKEETINAQYFANKSDIDNCKCREITLHKVMKKLAKIQPSLLMKSARQSANH